MKTINKYCSRTLWFTALLLTALVAGCSSGNDSSPAVSGNSAVVSDPAALSVIATNPDADATDVPTNNSVTASFSEAMNDVSIDTVSFTVNGAGEAALVGSVSLDAASNTAIFNPNSDLTPSTVYTATITTAAESTTGKTLGSKKVWTFTSGPVAETIPPTVVTTYPADLAGDFSLNRNITATFDESLDPSTVKASSFTLTDGGTPVPGIVSYNDNGMVASFNPTNVLAAGTTYTATLTIDVQDLAGNPLAAAKVWTFSGAATSLALLPVDLKTAGDFAILAKTAISKTGAAGTMIVGDIGVSPAALTAITGFSQTLADTYATSIFVDGSIYAANMTDPTPAKMTAAISDMELAYTDAAGRTLPDFTELGAGNVSGMTLEPGLYKWGTNVLITNVGVTISGSATDVWIFQIAQDLIVDNGAIVTLSGGALSKNIFWQVAGGTGVALGTTSQFAGVVLAQKAITVNSGATVNGRLFAQSAVTLDGNAVTEPAL